MDAENTNIDPSKNGKVPRTKKYNSTTFRPGNTCGKGRPVGSRNGITVALEEIGKENAQAIFQMVIDSSLGKLPKDTTFDIQAAKLILDRVIPIRKGARFTIGINTQINTIEEVDKASTAIFNLACEGGISLDEAQQLASILEIRAKSIELNQMAAEIAQLKEAIAANG